MAKSNIVPVVLTAVVAGGLGAAIGYALAKPKTTAAGYLVVEDERWPWHRRWRRNPSYLVGGIQSPISSGRTNLLSAPILGVNPYLNY